MSSALETLAPELLYLIAEAYGGECAAFGLLMRCSKILCSRLQPVLYGSQVKLGRAMLRACKTGNLHTLRVAISYGANMSTVRPIVECSTFMLAAERGHVEAFDFLIQQGATLWSNFEISPRFARSLCLPKNAAVLHSFLEKGFGSLPGAKLSLCSVIRGGGTPDIVRALIDQGSDINCHEHTAERHILSTPLSTAILVNQMPIVDLLIEKGADIHGTEDCNPFQKQLSYPFAKPLHLPIFAAAVTMARHGSTEMLQRCIDLGTDINYISQVRGPNWYHWYTYNTPLQMYLGSIEGWDPKATLRPVDGLKFLLQHGSSPDLPSRLGPQQCGEDANTISTIELLLDRWGVVTLGDHEFFATLEVLIEHGSGKDRLKEILTKYRIPEGNLLVHWNHFVALLTKKHFNPKDPAANNKLLQHIILHSNHSSTVEAMHHVTVVSLLQSGADINTFINSDGHTILHEMCSPIHMTVFSHISSCSHIHGSTERCKYARAKYAAFSFVRDMGADPSIVAYGKTPIDVLLGLMRQWDTISAGGEDFLVKSANILLGEIDKYSLSDLKALNILPKIPEILNSSEADAPLEVCRGRT